MRKVWWLIDVVHTIGSAVIFFGLPIYLIFVQLIGKYGSLYGSLIGAGVAFFWFLALHHIMTIVAEPHRWS